MWTLVSPDYVQKITQKTYFKSLLKKEVIFVYMIIPWFSIIHEL